MNDETTEIFEHKGDGWVFFGVIVVIGLLLFPILHMTLPDEDASIQSLQRPLTLTAQNDRPIDFSNPADAIVEVYQRVPSNQVKLITSALDRWSNAQFQFHKTIYKPTAKEFVQKKAQAEKVAY